MPGLIFDPSVIYSHFHHQFAISLSVMFKFFPRRPVRFIVMIISIIDIVIITAVIVVNLFIYIKFYFFVHFYIFYFPIYTFIQRVHVIPRLG